MSKEICKELSTMSSNNSKKSQLSDEELQVKKSQTVYNRLKRAYDFDNEEQLAKKFGLKTRQGINLRKNSGNWDPQEILDLFPDVNYDWVFSENLEDLRRLPVRLDPEESSDVSEGAESKDRLSDEEVKVRLEQIESIVKTLKDNF